MSGDELDLIVVAVASGAVGALEITERFKDEPVKALFTWPALFYVLVNGAAGILALLLIRLLDVEFGFTTEPDVQRWGQVIAAGFSAVVILRSVVFVSPDGAQTYGVGNFLQRLLTQAENLIRRGRGPKRADAAEKAAQDLTYPKAKTALGALALGQLPTAPDLERAELATAQKTIEESGETDDVKLLMLCGAVLNFGGEKVLFRAADQLRRMQ